MTYTSTEVAAVRFYIDQDGSKKLILVKTDGSFVEVALDTIGATRTFPEQSPDPAGVANAAVMFTRDDGNGNTEQCIRFATGAVFVLARQNTSSPVIVDAPVGTNYALNSSISTWADVDNEGTATVRPWDVVIPAVKVGDLVYVDPSFYIGSAAGSAGLDLATIVSGAAVHYTSSKNSTPLTVGISGWFTLASTPVAPTAREYYVVQTGDIENGSIRFRLRSIGVGGSAATRAISRTSGNRARLTGVGPV